MRTPGSCATCGRERGSGSFCEGCGAPLPPVCGSCGAEVSPEARFCGACGVRLEKSESPVAEGTRRQVAVLFCDVVGSTPLSQQMDVEDFGELLLAFQQLATQTITGLGGTISTYAGDGLVACFGWPVAHEDDTALAVQAGLDTLAKLNQLSDATAGAGGFRLSARAAVHVGPVVLRTERPDTPAFGETLHVAARLESFAEANALVVSDVAQRLIKRRFHTSPVGTPTLKGFDRPIPVHRVEGPRGPDDRPGSGTFDGPLVGRTHEVDQLLSAWTTARSGIGRTAVIRGEPGVGKSRLLTALRTSLTGAEHTWMEFRCSPLTVNSAFRPIENMVRRALGIGRSDDPAEQRAKIATGLPARSTHLIARLLGLDTPDELAPETFRHDLMEALQAWLTTVARTAPVVVVGEDMHWSDPSTLELIRLLHERLSGTRALIVLTARTEAAVNLPVDVEILLDRLGREDTRTLARYLAASHGLAPELAERVADRSDGVPLFVEELVAAAGEADDGSGLPTSLQSSLLARLDRLGPARDVAQLASVLGRSFPESLLAAAAGTGAVELADALQRLMAAGLIEATNSIDGLRYEFRHALIRDAAYASLLKSRRAQLHREVASVLQERFPERVVAEPELLGQHLAQGQEPVRAARCFELAGRRAARSAALAEAAAHYRHGIALLSDVVPAAERDRQEMWLGILLGNALMGLEGHGADSLRPVWHRAIELGERVGDADELTAALNGLAVQEADNAELGEAQALAQRQIDIAQNTGSRFARLRGHGTMGLVLFYRGRGREADEHFRLSLDCYRPGDFHTVTFGVGHDQGVFARAMRSWTLWWLGRPDSALAEAEETVADAEQLGSFLTLAMGHHFLAMIHQLRRETEAALQQAQRNATFCHELGFPYWEGVALLSAGGARTQLGDAEGLREIARGLELLRGASSRSGTVSGFATLAEAQHAAGDTGAALNIVTAALTRSQEIGQPYWDAELMRLKAKFTLTLAPDAAAEAEALLRRAVADATARRAGSPALRAATALAQRLAERDRGSEAGELLHTALSSIEGGEGTADVRDARTLLDQLPTALSEAKEIR